LVLVRCQVSEWGKLPDEVISPDLHDTRKTQRQLRQPRRQLHALNLKQVTLWGGSGAGHGAPVRRGAQAPTGQRRLRPGTSARPQGFGRGIETAPFCGSTLISSHLPGNPSTCGKLLRGMKSCQGPAKVVRLQLQESSSSLCLYFQGFISCGINAIHHYDDDEIELECFFGESSGGCLGASEHSDKKAWSSKRHTTPQ